MGQYIGGVDPIHTNDVIRPLEKNSLLNGLLPVWNFGEIIFDTTRGFKRPIFLKKDSLICVPIANLHIHSKNLKEYV